MINPSGFNKIQTANSGQIIERTATTARKFTISRAKKKTGPVFNKQQETKKSLKCSENEDEVEPLNRASTIENTKKRTREAKIDEEKENVGSKSSLSLQKKTKTTALENDTDKNVQIQCSKPSVSLSVSILHGSTSLSKEKESEKVEKAFVIRGTKETKTNDAQHIRESISSCKTQEPNISKLISYVSSLRCKECLQPYSTADDRQPKIVCWTQSTEGSVCNACANSMMKLNTKCSFCGMHTIRPSFSSQDFVTNGSLLEIIRLISDPGTERRDKINQLQNIILELVRNINENLDSTKSFVNNELRSKFLEPSIWNKVDDEIAMKEFIIKTLCNLEKSIENYTQATREKLEVQKLKLIESAKKSNLSNQDSGQSENSSVGSTQPNKMIEKKPKKLQSDSQPICLFALSKVVFLCIERDGVSFKIKIIDENQKTLNETQVVENNNIPKQSSNNLGLGAYFSKEFLVLSFLDSNKIIKYHHNHRFLPAIEMNLIGMRMLISSNDEICFYYDKRNVIRTFDFNGKKCDQIGPFQNVDKTLPFYATNRLELFSISAETLYIRDPCQNSNLVTIRIMARKAGTCIGKIDIQVNDQVLVDLLGRVVLVIRSRRRVFVFDSKDLKKTNEIQLQEKDVEFECSSITQENQLALMFDNSMCARYINLN